MGRINISDYLKPKFYYRGNVYYSVDEVIKALKKDCSVTTTTQSFNCEFSCLYGQDTSRGEAIEPTEPTERSIDTWQ